MANNLIVYFIADMVPTEKERTEAKRIESMDANNEVIFMNTRFGVDFMPCTSALGCIPSNFGHVPVFGAALIDEPNTPPPIIPKANEPKQTSSPVGMNKDAWKDGI